MNHCNDAVQPPHGADAPDVSCHHVDAADALPLGIRCHSLRRTIEDHGSVETTGEDECAPEAEHDHRDTSGDITPAVCVA